MKRFHPIEPILFGLFASWAVASFFVHQSNLALHENLMILDSAGYMVVPTRDIWPNLLNWGPAVWGAVFYATTSGVLTSVLGVAAAHIYRRLGWSRRLYILILVTFWAFGLLLLNFKGFSPLAATLWSVGPLVFLLAVITDRSNEKTGKTTLLTFILPLLIIGVLWGGAAVNAGATRTFLDVRDYVFWSNPIGKGLVNFYYKYTLYPAEAFKSLRQKTLKRVRIIQDADAPTALRLEVAFLDQDYLPLPEGQSVDVTAVLKDEVIHFNAPNVVQKTDLVDFLADPEFYLDELSDRLDRNLPMRRFTLISLLIGLPAGLYLFLFCLFRGVFRFITTERRAAVGAGLCCLALGMILLTPIMIGRMAVTDNVRTMFASDSWWSRTAGLRTAVEQKKDIAGFDYERFINSPHVAERYWVAVALGESSDARTIPDLQRMLYDPDINVACMALRSMGLRRPADALGQVRRSLEATDHWYVQWYAYRALRALGWRQTVSK
jgi:hypothetical protein